MISALKQLVTDCVDPYRNLAAEKLLTRDVREGECVLFLWRNRRTVVIGRNQNAWEECRVRQLEEDGGRLARRLSGGGAVYHDLGNLNFTFAVRKADYDPGKQAAVICRAVEKLGVAARRTGRNDLEADGRKFSGSAYYEARGRCFHHGTVMVDVDTDALSAYLTVSGAKLRSKGVASVRSRVVNLRELRPEITADRLKASLLEAFGEVYGLPVVPLEPGRLEETAVAEEAAVFASDAWLFPPRIPFTAALEDRFAWGGIRLELLVRGDRVVRAECVSDAMDESLVRRIGTLLADCPFRGEELARRVNAAALEEADAAAGQEVRRRMGRDIADMVLARLPRRGTAAGQAGKEKGESSDGGL